MLFYKEVGMSKENTVVAERKTHYRSDYQSPKFILKNTELHFKLHETQTLVESILTFEKKQISDSKSADLLLNGENMAIVQLKLDGKILSKNQYSIENDVLVVFAVPDKFILETIVNIDPQNNKTLNGLYLSNGNFTTQCEPHGFRCITYFLDRPDVLTNFTVKITADKEKYPVLLSNGNLIDSGDLDDGQHWVLWQDPTLKPCYLFALVAGDFDFVSSKFVTMNNRNVDLQVFVEKGKLDQADFALDALRYAMQWDEKVYQREYELDIYMIVAVGDFNFGAMENKGLNIFNDAYVLANSALATDQDYTNVLGVVGHEYFHNWSGNRVTCRDWFQLSLKEGLTIFRDQSFTADMTSAISKRISDVYIMKNYQFAEDAGPMSHPIRPESYVSMNNFYTNTVYNKGAEVIRMIETILGKKAFRLGMDEYFRTNDGLAVTTDDFVIAMEVASGVDLSQFRLWYSQSGTPDVAVDTLYDPSAQTFSVSLKQSIPGKESAAALFIPLRFGLLSSTGTDIAIDKLSGGIVADNVMHFNKKDQTFVFNDISEEPVLSILRNFSAPVRIIYERSPEELTFLLAKDSDLISRWEAASELQLIIIKDWYKALESNQSYSIPDFISNAFMECISNDSVDKDFLPHIFTMPTLKYLLLHMNKPDVVLLSVVIEKIKNYFASKGEHEWLRLYDDNNLDNPYVFSPDQVAARSSTGMALSFLSQIDGKYDNLIKQAYFNANNMTDKVAALCAISNSNSSIKGDLFSDFYAEYKNHPLVIDKWFRLQANDKSEGALSRVKSLAMHPAYDASNPNRVRAVVGVFASLNMAHFHAADGESYDYVISEIMRIDKFNPQLAARLCEPFISWRLLDKDRQKKIKLHLNSLLDTKGLSNDVFEVVSRSLQN